MASEHPSRSELVQRVAQAMADYANEDRYVLENGTQSTGVEPYENGPEDFMDLAEIAVKVVTA